MHTLSSVIAFLDIFCNFIKNPLIILWIWYFENPKILLLDCNLEYKKGESQTNIEIMKEDDFSKILEMEEAYIKKICDEIIKFSPDLVITEKGVSDLAQHFLSKAGISVIR